MPVHLPARSLFVIAACCALRLGAGDQSPKSKVRLAVGSKPGNLVYLQVDLARTLGYFAAEGLDVEYMHFQGGTGASDALVSGKAEFSGNSIDHAIQLRAQGTDLRMIASFTSLPTVTLVVRRDLRPRIRTIKDLKGARLGVTAVNAGTHVLAAWILKKAGCSPDEVTVIPVGAGISLIEAMRDRKIDAAMATDPTTTELLMSGQASILLDLVTYDETQRVFSGGYQFTGLLTRPDVVARHPDWAQKMVNAIVKADHFIATHSAAEISAALLQDSYIYVKSLEHSRPSFSKDGRVTADAVANSIQSLIVFGSVKPSARMEPASFFDMSFVQRANAIK
jgi:NitT/TauT family transport system substrate-binding protein